MSSIRDEYERRALAPVQITTTDDDTVDGTAKPALDSDVGESAPRAVHEPANLLARTTLRRSERPSPGHRRQGAAPGEAQHPHHPA
jgi:hypothetical protein